MEIKNKKHLTILIFLSLTMVVYLSLASNKKITKKIIDRNIVHAKQLGEDKKLNKAEEYIKERKEIYNKQITMNTVSYLNEVKAEKIDFELGPETRRKLSGEQETQQEQSQPTESKPLSRGGAVGTPVTLALTFYTDTHDENGGWGGYVANNKKIAPGMVASGNQLPFGTKIYIPSFGKNIAGLDNNNLFVVEDRMLESESYKTNGADYRVDIYVPRLSGEDEGAYKRRVNSYGRYNVQAYINS